MQAAVAGMSSGDFDPFGARYPIGTAAMACRTVSAVGPSESLQVFGGDGRVVGGFQAQPEAPSPTISANSANSARIGTALR
ncbi:Uncharacterised protein [Mycobacterium tuberculosis]|nr:Uncharacterised protein [Mycobacterium tuberculosis]